MIRSLVLWPEARQDLQDAHDWHEDQRGGLGVEFMEEIQGALERIRNHPLRWAAIEEDVRRCLTKRFPYGVFYLVEEERIVVLAVMHQAKDPESWRKRRRQGRGSRG